MKKAFAIIDLDGDDESVLCVAPTEDIAEAVVKYINMKGLRVQPILTIDNVEDLTPIRIFEVTIYDREYEGTEEAVSRDYWPWEANVSNAGKALTTMVRGRTGVVGYSRVGYDDARQIALAHKGILGIKKI